ncbi:MAG: aminotransferase class I/II-fold pyridoxal phosphate-dependent enzyme, partial [Sphingomonadales bacterium]
ERSHNCMFAGARLSGAEVKIFRHNDVAHAHMLLRESTSPRKLIMTETVFSMDGDTAPLLTLHELAEEYGAWFMTDDAHGLGVITESNPALIQMGTFSKAGGSYGGYICGPRPLIDLLINRGRGFIFTTGLPPGIVAASLKSLNIIKNEPQRQERLRRNVEYFCMELGLTVSPSAIVPLILGTEERALQASEQLFEKGFIVTAIRPPTVAPGTARLRFSFSSEHEFEDVQALVNAVRPIVSKKKVEAA